MGFILIIATALLCVSYAALLLHYRKSWKNIETPAVINAAFNPSVSFTIVIPARNESANITSCIKSVLSQNYPLNLFEVIVVDDHSEDDTCDKVRQLKSEKLILIKLEEQLSVAIISGHKKRAIEAAIKKAKGDWIITTDADCQLQHNWLLNIAFAVENRNPDMIVMPVRMKETGSLLGIFDSLDFLTLQGITGAVVSNNELNMCNGANLAYSRKAFESVGAFSGIDHISSGDDMLLMEKFSADNRNIIYLKSKEIIADTLAATGFNQFLNQRIRWASKSSAYKDKRIKGVLALVYCFNLFLLFSVIDCLIENHYFLNYGLGLSKGSLWVSVLIFKIFSEFIFLYPVSTFFERKRLLKWFIPLQPLHILYVIISGFLGLTRSYQWKGRRVK